MSWLKLAELPIKTLSDYEIALLDGLRMLFYEPADELVSIGFHQILEYLLRLLKQFKNKVSWRYIVIDYQYAIKLTKIPMMTVNKKTIDISNTNQIIVDVRNEGYLKRLYKAICLLNYDYDMFMLDKICAVDNTIKAASEMPAYLTIKKISVYKFHRKARRCKR